MLFQNTVVVCPWNKEDSNSSGSHPFSPVTRCQDTNGSRALPGGAQSTAEETSVLGGKDIPEPREAIGILFPIESEKCQRQLLPPKPQKLQTGSPQDAKSREEMSLSSWRCCQNRLWDAQMHSPTVTSFALFRAVCLELLFTSSRLLLILTSGNNLFPDIQLTPSGLNTWHSPVLLQTHH